ncbi:MAG: response regulator [Kiloniellaceae bacterium]
MKSRQKVLIVEDEVLIGELFKIFVEQLGYAACGIVGTADEAVSLARQEEPAVILMDVRLNGKRDGIDAAVEIHKFLPVPIIYITASREPETAERIERGHPAEVLIKPVVSDQLKSALAKHCPMTT